MQILHLWIKSLGKKKQKKKLYLFNDPCMWCVYIYIYIYIFLLNITSEPHCGAAIGTTLELWYPIICPSKSNQTTKVLNYQLYRRADFQTQSLISKTLEMAKTMQRKIINGPHYSAGQSDHTPVAEWNQSI